jgi:hypothetical protein
MKLAVGQNARTSPSAPRHLKCDARSDVGGLRGLIDVGFIKVRLASRVYGLGLSQQEEPGLARP